MWRGSQRRCAIGISGPLWASGEGFPIIKLPGRRSVLGEQSVENFQKGVDDGLAECIGVLCDFLIALIAGSER